MTDISLQRAERFLQRAIELAYDNARCGAGGPYGAVIAVGDELLYEAANSVTANNDPTAHAEIMAIRGACRKLGDFQLHEAVLYTSCEPCPMCLGAIYWARLAAVYYACDRFDAAAAGFDDQFIYDEIATPPAARRIPMQRLALCDRDRPFVAWRNCATRIAY